MGVIPGADALFFFFFLPFTQNVGDTFVQMVFSKGNIREVIWSWQNMSLASMFWKGFSPHLLHAMTDILEGPSCNMPERECLCVGADCVIWVEFLCVLVSWKSTWIIYCSCGCNANLQDDTLNGLLDNLHIPFLERDLSSECQMWSEGDPNSSTKVLSSHFCCMCMMSSANVWSGLSESQ